MWHGANLGHLGNHALYRLMRRRRAALTVLFMIGAAGPVLASPQVTALSESQVARSGRLLIFGNDFGAAGGEVLIDGISAIATTWTPTEIHAYVPETASPGSVGVQVVTSEGASNALPLLVTLRQPSGQIRWRFQTDRWMTRQFVAVGPDGMIYTSDHLGLYALSPGGGLVWFAPGAGGGRPISLGADGTIYTGVILGGGPAIIKALNPDGSLKWGFTGSSTLELLAGPNVGPDGNIYAMQDQFSSDPDSGLGMFSLDPAGGLRWSNDGEPAIFSLGGSNSEVVFASDRLYAGVKFTAAPPPTTFAFRLDNGNQLWYTGPGGLGVYFHSFPRVDPQERAIGKWGQTGLIALLPDGQTDWIEIQPLDGGTDCTPTVDSQGVIFTGDDIGLDLWSVNPDGSTRWVLPSDGSILQHLGVSPEGAVLVVGGSDDFGSPGWLRRYDTPDGTLLWQVDLVGSETGCPCCQWGCTQHVSNLYPAFSNDADTAYVTTVFNDVGVIDYGYLYAIDTGQPGLPGDLDGDGTVGVLDFLALLGAWGSCPEPAAPCPADLDGDGMVGVVDLLALLANWTA